MVNTRRFLAKGSLNSILYFNRVLGTKHSDSGSWLSKHVGVNTAIYLSKYYISIPKVIEGHQYFV